MAPTPELLNVLNQEKKESAALEENKQLRRQVEEMNGQIASLEEELSKQQNLAQMAMNLLNQMQNMTQFGNSANKTQQYFEPGSEALAESQQFHNSREFNRVAMIKNIPH